MSNQVSEAVLAGVFGLLIGSFLNVCIYRWPRDLSVVAPRSGCPACSAPIRALDNIPVLSFLLLRGRCRTCHNTISWRYPTVELLTALSFFSFTFQYGLGGLAGKYCLFACLLIGLVFADLETLILPDQFTLGGLIAGLLFSLWLPVPDITFQMVSAGAGLVTQVRAANVGEAVLGAFLPAFFLWLGGWIFEKVRHKEGLGFGDVKMIAMVGAFVGLRGCLLTIVVGSVLGSVVGGGYILIARKKAGEFQLPFATFLGVAAFFVAIRGPELLAWYDGFSEMR